MFNFSAMILKRAAPYSELVYLEYLGNIKVKYDPAGRVKLGLVLVYTHKELQCISSIKIKKFIKDVSLASARARLKCDESTSADLNRNLREVALRTLR